MEMTDWRYLSGFLINVLIFIVLMIKGKVDVSNVLVLIFMIVFSWVGTTFFVLGWLVNKFPYFRYGLTGDLEHYKTWKESKK